MPDGLSRQFVRLSGLKRYFDVSPPWLVRKLEGKPRQIVQAVDGIDIEIAKGETFSLVGESGCGKSTVARLVVGLYPPTDGAIEFDGNDMGRRRSRTDLAAIRSRASIRAGGCSTLSPSRFVPSISPRTRPTSKRRWAICCARCG
jgi:peptide/nickel transport system ATP-binding protein